VVITANTAALAEPLPQPRPSGPGGSCPHGWTSSGSSCVLSQGAQDPVPKPQTNHHQAILRILAAKGTDLLPCALRLRLRLFVDLHHQCWRGIRNSVARARADGTWLLPC
jgi:hypothetical protein